jgi:amino acid permease
MNILSRQLGAILIVAGTAIGGGMIALPIMVAKLGI